MKQAVTKNSIGFIYLMNIVLLFFFCGELNAQLEIVNVRIGQGDATIIQGPLINNKRVNILIDGGNISNRDAGNILRTVLNKRQIKHLDYVIVSHYDADHIGGIISGTRHGVSLLLGFNGEPGEGVKSLFFDADNVHRYPI